MMVLCILFLVPLLILCTFFVFPTLLRVAAHGKKMPSPTPTFAAMPSSSGNTFTDAQGNVWTLEANQKVYENGKPAGHTANVIQLLYSNGIIYHENAKHNWYSWNGSGWTRTSAPSNQPSTTPTPAGKTGKMMKVKVTFYAYSDNNPHGRAIAYPHSSNPQTIHNEAGGSGTYDDPLTMATDRVEGWPLGTRIYAPFIKKYVVYEDSCGCDAPPHIDIWMNSNGSNVGKTQACEYYWTQDSTSVEINPPAGRDVSTAPLFNTNNATCLKSV